MDQLALLPIHHRWLRCVPLDVALLRLRGPRLASGAPRRQAFVAHLGPGSWLLAYRRKDSFYQRAKREGYASRAAYKLVEIDEAQRIFRAGQRVVDLGCWPGGWLQVAAEKVGPSGRVAGIDLAPIDPPLELENVLAVAGDLAEPSALASLLEYLGGRAEVLLSDAAPKLSGVRASDRAREEALLEAVEVAIAELLRPGGLALVKLLDCPEAQAFEKRLRRRFGKARKVRPKASRKGSSESYLLARDYRG